MHNASQLADSTGRKQFVRRPHNRPAAFPAFLEPLESRRLLAFSTVDVIPGGELWGGMAADGSGNVYVGGFDATHTIVRQGSNGGTSWSNILELPFNPAQPGNPEVWSVAASPAGDVYARIYNGDGTSSWSIWQRPAGDTQFHQVHSSSVGALSIGWNSLSVDSGGKAYALATVPVTVQLPGNKTTTQYRAAVTRQTGPLGSFATVDVFGAGEYPAAIYASTLGVYAVGRKSVTSGSNTINHWIVRKSVSGNSGTWSTVDDFQYDSTSNLNSDASAVTVDVSGTVHVAGTGYKKVRTGGTDKKPIYSNLAYTLVRSRASGSPSWKTDEVMSGTSNEIYGITNNSGTVYLATTSGSNSTVRSKAFGATSWNTIDQFSNAYSEGGIVADSNGSVYVAGIANGPEGGAAGYYGFVRCQPSRCASATPLSPFGNTLVDSNSSQTDQDDPLLAALA